MTTIAQDREGREETLATLLSEGLDLCVRAKSLDEQAIKKSMRDFSGGDEAAKKWPETYGRSGTPYLWIQQQYDTDLAAWEAKAKATLFKMGFAK